MPFSLSWLLPKPRTSSVPAKKSLTTMNAPLKASLFVPSDNKTYKEESLLEWSLITIVRLAKIPVPFMLLRVLVKSILIMVLSATLTQLKTKSALWNTPLFVVWLVPSSLCAVEVLAFKLSPMVAKLVQVDHSSSFLVNVDLLMPNDHQTNQFLINLRDIYFKFASNNRILYKII